MISKLFNKILIANRGEIACRITRTCRRLGIQTVAVYSDADAGALHVRLADEAVHLGAAAARESYLAIDKVLAAAKRTGAQAIHPGYGFLSENDRFAEACEAAGVVFIGPPASAIRAMGSKSAAKALMAKAGVPLTPGYHGDEQSPAFLERQAEAIGYPVLIKASAGGGGKGMRRVEDRSGFLPALAACQREAAAAFGDDRVLIERYITEPRHIEIQIFADQLGNAVSLFERDCSVQRRHQKVLEEAPAPGMTEERRAAMGEAACEAARAVGYVGAGTVEFIADKAGNFHFMEMNTRLQVEHPVTECITGLDLVEWQIRIAAGESLPLTQSQLRLRGHALEARIYAEDPENEFRPSVGKLVHLKMPRETTHIRVDAGVEQGDIITAFYDPMIAKLIVWDETREAALQTMGRALAEIQVAGVVTNVDFLARLIASPSFMTANLDTALIEREWGWLQGTGERAPTEACLFAALAMLLHEAGGTAGRAERRSPWSLADGWRMNGSLRRVLRFTRGEDLCNLHIEYGRDAYRMQIGEETYAVSGALANDDEVTATIDGLRKRATVISAGHNLHVFLDGHSSVFQRMDEHTADLDETAGESSLLAPIPGIVKALLVEPGVALEKGAPLLVLEAMKMEYTIVAPAAGTVESFSFAPGEQVPEGTQLLTFARVSGSGE